MSRRRISIKTALTSSMSDGAGALVCVSGGRDSMVMLDALARLRRLKGLRLTACHIDHGLRVGSQRDAEFVQERCSDYGIECVVERLQEKPPKVNMEAWAREGRYAVFRRVTAERKLDVFLTAHTANDVAETLLIRLLANKELNTIEESDSGRACLRPLLGISRAQIDEYVRRFGVSFVEDPTNSNTELVRNRIRLNALPFLEREFDVSLVWSLSERAQSLAADAKALRQWAEGAVSALLPPQLDNREWRVRCSAVLLGLPPAVRWRMVELLFSGDVGFLMGERRASAVVAALLGLGPEVRLGDKLFVSAERE